MRLRRIVTQEMRQDAAIDLDRYLRQAFEQTAALAGARVTSEITITWDEMSQEFVDQRKEWLKPWADRLPWKAGDWLVTAEAETEEK